MKKSINFKHFISGTIFGLVIALPVSGLANSTLTKIDAFLRPDFSIQLDGKKLELDNPVLVTSEGSSYLPLREMSEKLGLAVGWDDETGTVMLNSKSKDDKENNDVSLNGTNNNEKDVDKVSNDVNVENEYVSTGTEKTFEIDGHQFTIDFYGFEFVDPSDFEKSVVDGIEKMLNFKVMVNVPFDVNSQGYHVFAKFKKDESEIDINWNTELRTHGLKKGTNIFNFKYSVIGNEYPTNLEVQLDFLESKINDLMWPIK